MSDSDSPKPPEGEGNENQPQRREGGFSQRVQHTSVTARVPEKVARGVFSTGVIIIDGPYEFVIDYVMALAQPKAVVARVVMSPVVLEQFIAALKDNIGKYEARFGPIPATPKPPQPQRQPTVQEIYDDLKLGEEMNSGVYANAVLINHGPTEFSFDFITRFFPNAAVSARVFMAAGQAPRMLESLGVSLNRYKQRVEQMRRDEQRPPDEPLTGGIG